MRKLFSNHIMLVSKVVDIKNTFFLTRYIYHLVSSSNTKLSLR